VLLQQVDNMPGRPPCHWKEYQVKGPSSNGQTQRLEMWYCDPVALVAELIGNPLFANDMSYAPCQRYSDEGRLHREYSEMSEGDWWWDVQVCIGLARNLNTVTLTSIAGSPALWGHHCTGDTSKRQDTPHQLLQRYFRISGLHFDW
jgi:hypothetical protein